VSPRPAFTTESLRRARPVAQPITVPTEDSTPWPRARSTATHRRPRSSTGQKLAPITWAGTGHRHAVAAFQAGPAAGPPGDTGLVACHRHPRAGEVPLADEIADAPCWRVRSGQVTLACPVTCGAGCCANACWASGWLGSRISGWLWASDWLSWPARSEPGVA